MRASAQRKLLSLIPHPLITGFAVSVHTTTWHTFTERIAITWALMASIIGGIGTSHVPTIAMAYDRKKQNDPDWAPLFKGYEPVARWMAERKPDVLVFFYNDHATTFFFDHYPTFALGVSAEYPIADEGLGPRPVPPLKGHARARAPHGRVAGQRRVRHLGVPGPADRPRLPLAAHHVLAARARLAREDRADRDQRAAAPDPDAAALLQARPGGAARGASPIPRT